MLVDVQQRLRHGDVEELATSRSFALEECGKNSCSSLHPGVHIAVAEWVVGVVAVAYIALMLRESRLCIHHWGICTTIDPWTGGAVAADRGIDEAWISRGQLVVSESQTFHDPGSKILDHHITDVGQSAGDVHGTWMSEIQRDVRLPDVLLDEVRSE